MTSPPRVLDDEPGPGSPTDAISAPEVLPGEMPAPRPSISDEWQRPPWNRWSFQHVSELVPTARVSRGSVSVWELPADPVYLEPLPVDTSVGTVTFADMLERSDTDALLVLHHGRVVTERYWHGMRRETRHLLQSVSKSLTGMLAGALEGRGRLDTNAQASGYVPELSGTSFDGVTVRHLLDMTAGTKFSEDYDDPEADVNLFESAAGWRPRVDRQPTDLLSYIRSLGNTRGHGEVFGYRSILTDVLGLVLERASGRRFADLLSSLVWSRAGMEQDAEVTVDRLGYAVADGGMSATARDVARAGQLLLQGGCVEGRQLLPAAWVADTRYADETCTRAFLASEDAGKLAICEPAATVCLPKGHYRNQWWVPDPAEGVLLASGIFGQVLYIDLTRNVVVAKLSSQPAPFDAELSADVLRACAAVAMALHGA